MQQFAERIRPFLETLTVRAKLTGRALWRIAGPALVNVWTALKPWLIWTGSVIATVWRRLSARGRMAVVALALLENREQNDEDEEPARVEHVDFPEIVEKSP